jgi:hypothetical protein
MSSDSIFPSEPKKIRERIKRYERAFSAPHHDDGAGKRFLLGPLYLLSGDTEGALNSYVWYKRTFPDDIPESFNHLCWILTLIRSDREAEARTKFREMLFDNLYVVPVFLGETPTPHPFRHFSNWSELSYVLEGPTELFDLWNADERVWLKTEWTNSKLQEDIRNYIAVQMELDQASGPDLRGKLIQKAAQIATGRHLRAVP